MSRPNINHEMAKELVLQLYGLKVLNIRQMDGYDDQNFHVQVSPTYENPYIKSLSPDGYTLKIQNPTKTATPGYIESTHYVLNFVHEKGLPVPIPILNLHGTTCHLQELPILQKTESRKQLDNKGICGIHLLSFIPGNTMNTITYTRNILKQWGQLLGKFQNSLKEFENKDIYNKEVWWTLPHLLEITEYMTEINEEKSELVLSVLKSYEKIQSDIAKMPKGYIHGDFNETNVIAHETSSGNEVTGILDMEHVHYGTYVWDVGLMLAYVSLGCDNMDPIEGMGYALAGYLQIRTLSPEEIYFLKICIVSRLCQTLVMGPYNFKLDPTNLYTLVSSRSGWSRLKVIWNTPNEKILKIWNDIQKIED